MASHKKLKRMTIRRASPPNSDINVTPLVDVVLVLLIIFMVVTPLLEKDIEVKVPDTQKTDTVEDVPQDQLIVSVNDKGEIKINTEVVKEEDYVNRLKRMVAAKAAGEKLVFFMPDEKANYGTLIKVLDGAKQAGAETLGMMTELPEGGLPTADPAAPGGATAAQPGSP